jgi:uncharacterized protein YcfJ
MSIVQNNRRIHPLVAVAAAAVTLFSLVGIAAVTGLLPNSYGSVQKTDIQTVTQTDTLAEAKPTAKTLLPKPVAQSGTGVSKAGTQDTAARGQRETEPVPVTAPAPVAHKQEPKNSPVGIGVGAVIGGVLGNQVGSGDGKTLATILGAVGGGYIGNEVAKKNQQ